MHTGGATRKYRTGPMERTAEAAVHQHVSEQEENYLTGFTRFT
jgi:hypothetical protein